MMMKSINYTFFLSIKNLDKHALQNHSFHLACLAAKYFLSSNRVEF